MTQEERASTEISQTSGNIKETDDLEKPKKSKDGPQTKVKALIWEFPYYHSPLDNLELLKFRLSSQCPSARPTGS